MFIFYTNTQKKMTNFRIHHLYIHHPSSCIIVRAAHPKQTNVNLVRAQFWRAIRISSDEQAKERSLSKMSDLLEKNGYPRGLLSRVRKESERVANGHRSGRDKGGRTGGQRGSKGTDHRAKGNYLTLPYVDETILCKVKRAVKKSKFKVRLGWYSP